MSYFSKNSRFEPTRSCNLTLISANYTGPGGQQKKAKFETKRAHMQRLSKLEYESSIYDDCKSKLDKAVRKKSSVQYVCAATVL